jgi:prepilin-type processing-associated H-X9-DG protein
MLAMEGADGRDFDRSLKDPHEYNAKEDAFVWAHPKFEHAHASQWFSQINKDWGLVESAVKADLQIDRHFHASHYLYVDGHVDALPAAQIKEWIDADFEFALPQ